MPATEHQTKPGPISATTDAGLALLRAELSALTAILPGLTEREPDAWPRRHREPAKASEDLFDNMPV